MNELLQYTIVALILLSICIWMLYRLLRKNKRAECNDASSCSDCALSEACKKNKSVND